MAHSLLPRSSSVFEQRGLKQYPSARLARTPDDPRDRVSDRCSDDDDGGGFCVSRCGRCDGGKSEPQRDEPGRVKPRRLVSQVRVATGHDGCQKRETCSEADQNGAGQGLSDPHGYESVAARPSRFRLYAASASASKRRRKGYSEDGDRLVALALGVRVVLVRQRLQERRGRRESARR